MSSDDDELPNYSDVGDLGEPPQYQNTESAAGHRTKRGNLPVFEDDEQPPTYESLFGQIKEEWLTADNFLDFLRKAGAILLASLACTLLLLVLLILPLAYIVIGAMYLNQCPINRWIPIYLIVAGILGLLQNGLMLLRKQVPNNAVMSISYRVYELFIGIISIIWFILGTIWVYSVFTKVCFNNEDGRCYCNSVCYWFAFVMITITYILLVIIIIVVCVVLVLSVQMFDRRQIEANTDGYEELQTPEPDTPIANVDPEENQLTGGLFLGDDTFIKYNTTSETGRTH